MRVALVHDDLVQWGGAERVLAALCELFPDAPIYTSLYNEDDPLIRSHFLHKKVITSFMQKIPGSLSLYKSLLPFFSISFEQFNFDDYDLVISQTTRFAKAIVTKPQTLHICYCHTPPRFLWNYSKVKSSKILAPYLSYLRNYDAITSARVDYFIAGSKNAQSRIQDVYHRESPVVYPFTDQPSSSVKPFAGGYLLVVGRLNDYKRIDLAILASQSLGLPLKVVGTGPSLDYLKSLGGLNVEFLGKVSEELLQRLLAGCQALLVLAEEDFGMMPLEANSYGKPVVAYGQGGSKETVINGKTGYLFDSQTIESLVEALQYLKKYGYNEDACLAQARRFSKASFMNSFTKEVSTLLKADR